MSDKIFHTNVAKFTSKDGDNILYPFGPPLFQTEVDPNFTKELLEEGRKLNIKEDDFNHKLAGNLKYGRSFTYKHDYIRKVEPYLIKYVDRFMSAITQQYSDNCNHPDNYDKVQKLFHIQTDIGKARKGKLKLESLWINFSQKHDFNPPHSHTGVLSFVIFCKVPEQIFEVQADSNTRRAGEIVFGYGEQITPLGGTEFPIKPYEDLMFIFPATLRHYVPSYWIDEERISVSGNFVVV